MQHDLGMENSLSKKQFGFKKGTLTETALHKVIHKIEKKIATKGYVLGTFLDIEGAFDNVSFKAISEAIDQSPPDSATAGWIKNMVTNRHNTQKRNQAYQNQTRMPTGWCAFTIPVEPGNRRPSTIHSKTHPGLLSSFCRRHHVSSGRR